MNTIIRLIPFLLLGILSFADTPPTVLKVNGKIGNVVLTTTDINEGTNLYYTSARFNSSFASKSTTDLTEGTNLYFTNARAVNACTGTFEPTITAGTTAQYWRGDKTFQTLNTTAVPEGSNLYYTQGRFDSAFGAKSTTDLTEGTNLYYTQGRFDSAFAAKSTTNLSEGSNLYYTDTRARNSVSATSPITYVPATGVFSLDTATLFTSPALTGVPTAPTAGVGTSTTQIATTAFVLSQGFTGATGSMPSASSTSLVSTTSASTTFVTALTTSITVTASSAPVKAACVLDMTSATAVGVATTRVTVNGVSGGSVTESFTVLGTQHLTIANQNLSTALGPGTYTVNCDFNRASGTGTITVGQGSLVAIALQGTSSNGITQLTGALQAGPGSGSQALTGTLPIANGGTNQTGAAVNGAVIYSTASAYGYTAAGSSGQILRSAGAASPTWTSETFPASTTINQILYSSANNVVSGLATANTGALVTSSTGVPSIASGATANRLLRTNGTTVSFAQAALATDVSGTLPVANGGTGLTSVANQRVPFGTGGTALATDAQFLYDTTNVRLSVGGVSSAKIGAVITAGGTGVGMQSFCEHTNNCVQIRNDNAYNLSMLTANDANTTGVLVGAERSRGNQTTRTQALNGDIGLQLVGSCYTGSASSTGFLANIQYVQSEDCTASANGGEMVFYTTPNTTTALVERARITNDGYLKGNKGVTINTSGTQPTCTSSIRGTWWVIQGGAGVADILQICLKDAADNYNWVTK